MIAMFLRKRVKYALIFPTAFNTKIKHLKKRDYILHSVDIVGNPSYIYSRIACTKTPLGKKVIDNINHILDEIYLSDEFFNIHTDFLPENYHLQFKEDLTQLIQDNELL